MRLIDADELWDALNGVGGTGAEPDSWADGYDRGIDVALGFVETAPTVDIDPESIRPHGRWINPYEQLPMAEEVVLVIVSGKPKRNITIDNAYELASFSVDEGWILEEWPEWEGPEVKYWAELPEPPKEVICDE